MNRKVQPLDTPGTELTISVAGPKNYTAGAQLVVHAREGNIRDVTILAGDLSDGQGNTIAADNIVFFRQVYIDFKGVTAHGGTSPVPESSQSGADGHIPDPLIPLVNPRSGGDLGQPFAVDSGQNQPVWVDINIPTTTTPGTYFGEITVLDGEHEVTVPVEVNVWDLVLPDMNVVTTHFRLELNPLINYHREIYDCNGNDCWLNWSDHAREVVRRYEELVHSHRIDGGQHMFYTPSDGCAPVTDWAEYDAALTPYMDGSYFEDGVAASRIAVPFSPGVDWGIEADCTAAEYTQMAAAWAAHLKTKGWFERSVIYAYDEPPAEVLPLIAQHSDRIIAGDPDWKDHIMVTTAPDPDNIDILRDSVGIFCVAPAWYDRWGNPDREAFGRSEWPALMGEGISLWFYESNAQEAPYVSFATNTLDGAESTMMFWGSFYESATGFLYWSMSAWDEEDPWGPATDWNKTGDGVLIYPGHHDGLMAPAGSPDGVEYDGPIPSYRLKMIRQGLADWALFIMAREAGLGTFAREQIHDAYRQLGGCEWQGCDPPLDEFFW
ncbi:DUF4091 domain-containing protein, partial [Myxococcota bacterium]|nr:DUF4091 domain-containing protein [Myxococcota bacterium]